MIHILNLDDFIRIGGEYRITDNPQKHLWGWSCEYELWLPSKDLQPVMATVAVYRHGGRYVISDGHVDRGFEFFQSVRDEIYRRKDILYDKDSIKRTYGSAICSVLIFAFRVIVPGFYIVLAVLSRGDIVRQCGYTVLCFASFGVSFFLWMLRLRVYGYFAISNDDLSYIRSLGKESDIYG